MKKLLLLVLFAGCISVNEPTNPNVYHGYGEWIGVVGDKTTDTITVTGNDSTLRCSLVEYVGSTLKKRANYEFKNTIDGIDTGYIENGIFYMKRPIGRPGVSAYLMITATH